MQRISLLLPLVPASYDCTYDPQGRPVSPCEISNRGSGSEMRKSARARYK